MKYVWSICTIGLFLISCSDAFCPGIVLLKSSRLGTVTLKSSSISSEEPIAESCVDSCVEQETRIRRLQNAERDTDQRVMKLERTVKGLENIVVEMCSALLYCDDVALMERQARRVGDIYLDADFETIRRPRMLRQELMSMMNKNNMSTKPLMYTWQNVRGNNRLRFSQDEVE